MSAAAIVAAMDGKRGRCACPSCRDAGRDRGGDHLAVREDGGRVLVHCHAGCEQGQVIAALRARGLWPETSWRDWTTEARRQFAAAKRVGAEDGRRCWRWSIAVGERLNEAKRAAIDHDSGQMDVRALEAAAKAAREIEGSGPGAALAAWRRAWSTDPQQAAADEAAGEEMERAGEILCRLAVDALAGRGAE